MSNSLTSYTKYTHILIVHITDIYDPLTWDIKMTVKERNILKTVKKKFMFFWPCIMNWLYINYQLEALIIIYS